MDALAKSLLDATGKQLEIVKIESTHFCESPTQPTQHIALQLAIRRLQGMGIDSQVAIF